MIPAQWPVIAVRAHVPVGGNGANPVYELGKEDGPKIGYFSGGKSSPLRKLGDYGEVRDAEFWVRLDPEQMRRMLAEYDAAALNQPGASNAKHLDGQPADTEDRHNAARDSRKRPS